MIPTRIWMNLIVLLGDYFVVLLNIQDQPVAGSFLFMNFLGVLFNMMLEFLFWQRVNDIKYIGYVSLLCTGDFKKFYNFTSNMKRGSDCHYIHPVMIQRHSTDSTSI